MKATVDGVEVQIEESPAFTYSFLDHIDIGKTKGDYSTEISITPTNGSRLLLGSENMQEVPTKRDFDFRMGNDGFAFWASKLRIKAWSKDSIEATAYGGVMDWGEDARNLNLRDVDYGNTPAINNAYIQSTWVGDTDIIYFPLIDYGSFEDMPAGTNVVLEKMRPAVRVWRVAAAAFQSIGWTLTANGRLIDIWRKLVMPNVDEDLRSVGCPAISTDASVAAYILNNLYIVYENNTPPTPFVFGGIISDPNSNMYSDGTYFVMPSTANQTLRVSLCSISFFFDTAINLGDVILAVLYDSTAGAILDSQPIVLNSPTGWITFTLQFSEVVVPAGNTLYVGFSRIGSPAIGLYNLSSSGTLTQTVAYDTGLPDAAQSFQPYIVGEPLIIASACPDLSLAELLKSMVGLLDITVDTDYQARTINLWLYDEFTKPLSEGRNMQGREDHTVVPRKVVQEIPTEYQFRFDEDSGDRLLVDYAKRLPAPGYGNLNVPMSNGTEKPEVIDLDFAATAMGYVLGGLHIPIMRKEGGTYQTDEYGYTPRILIADDLQRGTWNFDGVSIDDYPKCYFVHKDVQRFIPGPFDSYSRYSLSFANETIYGDSPVGTVQQFYLSRLYRINNSFILDIDLRWWDDELVTLDKRAPIYVSDGYGGGWYYLLTIDQKRFGVDEYTRTELLQA